MSLKLQANYGVSDDTVCSGGCVSEGLCMPLHLGCVGLRLSGQAIRGFVFPTRSVGAGPWEVGSGDGATVHGEVF